MGVMNHVIGTSMLAAAVVAGAVTVSSADTVLEISATQPEFFAQDRAIWDIYEDENPGVTIELFSINEDTEAAYQARVAAGDPGDVRSLVFPTSDNYQTYVNLLDIDYPYWDLFTYDVRNIFAQTNGVEGYLPALNVRDGLFFTFVYYEDVLNEAGLDPKTIENIDDLLAFLDEMKAFVETQDDIEYVLDIAWHPRVWGRWMMEAWGIGLGASKQDFRDLWAGDIRWDDLENNPFVPAFELAREFTEAGYFPENWWTRTWEQEYEASFISGRSVLAYHGPWLWGKTLAQNPDAQLNGFFFPANDRGEIWQDGTTADRGSALYVANLNDDNFDAARDALIWWTSPETVKIRAEAIGFLPAMDLSSVGGVSLTDPQYLRVLQPAIESGNFTFDNSLGGQSAAGASQRSGTPFVIEDNSVAPIVGQYMTGEIDMAALMAIMQERWELSYEQ